MISVDQILTIIAWGGVGLLVLVLYRIARFYQVTSGNKSYYQLFLVPLVLLLLGALRYAAVGDLAGDVWGDVLLILGGASLIAVVIMLWRLMSGGHK